MLITEYRVILPMSVERYQVGQLYTVAECSKENTGSGDGIEVVKNEPYERDGERGQYTNKMYHLNKKVPGWMAAMAPTGSLKLLEEAWNAYPYCKTEMTNQYFTSFKTSIETIHLDDAGQTENAHKLSEEELKLRTVVYIDIANDRIYSEQHDPKKVRSEKAQVGPLGAGWIEKRKAAGETLMCAYKLVKIEGNFGWGITGSITQFVASSQQKLFTMFHQKLFCWLDDWLEMTMEDIRAWEAKTKQELADKINK